jgi:hypothetical protein
MYVHFSYSITDTLEAYLKLTWTGGRIDRKTLRWAGPVVLMGKRRGAYRVLVGKPAGRRPLGIPSRRWENIKMDLPKVEQGHGLD